jgi:regulator of nonsense transcripts 1
MFFSPKSQFNNLLAYLRAFLPACLPGALVACSRWFYGGRLRDGVAAADKPPAAGVEWPVAGCPVMMLGIQGLEEKAEKSGQKVRLCMAACMVASYKRKVFFVLFGHGPVAECPVMLLGIQGLEEKAEKNRQKVRLQEEIRLCMIAHMVACVLREGLFVLTGHRLCHGLFVRTGVDAGHSAARQEKAEQS